MLNNGKFEIIDNDLDRYADLIVTRGINVQPGQLVNISAELYHRDFVCKVVEQAYKRGASFVQVDLVDTRLNRVRIKESDPKHLSFVPQSLHARYKELVDVNAANLKIIGPEHPDILCDLDPKAINQIRVAQHKAMKYFYDEGIERSKVHWCVAAAPTPRWAKKIFPGLSEEDACMRLWHEIIKIARVDREDYLDAAVKHNNILKKRAEKLTALGISELHFTGPGTDLKVGLSKLAIFCGGGDKGPYGEFYEPNIPTEECFTTPDWRLTSGTVSATRPFLVNGKLIRGLKLNFKEGRIESFTCDDGEATFAEYIRSDEGARRLGEVALVGTDSPVFQSGLVFEEILFDENAACHIALGSSYKMCLKNGPFMTEEELQNIGSNESSVHSDIMISSEKVDVTATTFDGKHVQLIKNGAWLPEFID